MFSQFFFLFQIQLDGIYENYKIGKNSPLLHLWPIFLFGDTQKRQEISYFLAQVLCNTDGITLYFT